MISPVWGKNEKHTCQFRNVRVRRAGIHPASKWSPHVYYRGSSSHDDDRVVLLRNSPSIIAFASTVSGLKCVLRIGLATPVCSYDPQPSTPLALGLRSECAVPCSSPRSYYRHAAVTIFQSECHPRTRVPSVIQAHTRAYITLFSSGRLPLSFLFTKNVNNQQWYALVVTAYQRCALTNSLPSSGKAITPGTKHGTSSKAAS